MSAIRFIVRNPGYSVQNVRRLPAVARAMREYAMQFPDCAYCGRTGSVDVHHIEPVHDKPDLAGYKSNMISLCRKPACHIVIGHRGNFSDSNPRVRQVCDANKGDSK